VPEDGLGERNIFQKAGFFVETIFNPPTTLSARADHPFERVDALEAGFPARPV